MRHAAAVLVLALVACSGEGPCLDSPPCSFSARGACVALDPADPPPAVTAEDVETAIDAGLDFWGADRSLVSGWTIVLRGSPFQRGSQTVGAETDPICSTVTLSPYNGCPVHRLAHEIGHIALDGDGTHEAQRWREGSAFCGVCSAD